MNFLVVGGGGREHARCETQPITARMRGDLGAVLLGAARGEMPVGALGYDARAVIAAAGYPGSVRTGDPITGLPAADAEVTVFHAGIARVDGALVSACGISVDHARSKACAAAVVQPGGSVRDEEVIGAANEHHLAMLFTGMRHLRH